jgi:hypothetical protein
MGHLVESYVADSIAAVEQARAHTFAGRRGSLDREFARVPVWVFGPRRDIDSRANSGCGVDGRMAGFQLAAVEERS